jgi:hypothetical protein
LDTLAYWAISDVFDEIEMHPSDVSLPYHNGYGLITCDGIPKPSFRAFQILSSLPNMSLPVHATSAEHAAVEYAQTIYRQDGPLESNLTAVAFPVYADDGSVQRIVGLHVLLSHFVPCASSSGAGLKACEQQAMAQAHQAPYDVVIRINTSTPTAVQPPHPSMQSAALNATATVQRIDSKHANPRPVWEAMGSPKTITPLQKQLLLKASGLVEEPLSITSTTGTVGMLEVELSVPVFGVADVWIRFADNLAH